MPKIKYQEIKLSAPKLAVIAQANAIIAEYAAQGFDLTLRQLYYQFVARDLIPNRLQEYKRLGDIVNDGRLAGLIDWEAIVDRTRHLRSLAHWDGPNDIVEGASQQFRVDKWLTQPHRVEVWIEKDALVGVIAGVCDQLDVPYFSCRGYTSQSEMWSAARRLKAYRDQTPIILHFGDHDPSGVDMTRDITDRLEMFMGGLEVKRLALNFDQVQEHNPPPNPAKLTDSRCGAYIKRFGDESWELDALDPATLAGLIRDEIEGLQDDDAWGAAVEKEVEGRQQLDNENGGAVRDIRDLSGGEQVIVAEALMNSVALYVNERSQTPMRTIFRDETTGALNKENTQRYIQMLRKVLELGRIHQILFISHDPDAFNLADAQIRIEGGKATPIMPPYREAA